MLKKKFILDSYDTHPKEILDAMRNMWATMELGNDYYYVGLCNEMLENPKDWSEHEVVLAKYVKENYGLDPDDVLVHFWW